MDFIALYGLPYIALYGFHSPKYSHHHDDTTWIQVPLRIP